MKGICHLWSRGRLISPSLPVGDDWYLNLNSRKATSGPKSRGASFGTTLWHRVQRYCCLLILFAHAHVPESLVSYHIRGKQYRLFQKFKISHHLQNLFQYVKRNTYNSKLRAEISGNIVRYDALSPRSEVLLSWYFVCACAATHELKWYHLFYLPGRGCRGRKEFLRFQHGSCTKSKYREPFEGLKL